MEIVKLLIEKYLKTFLVNRETQFLPSSSSETEDLGATRTKFFKSHKGKLRARSPNRTFQEAHPR